MRSSAHIVACADSAGRTILASLRGEAPLLPRRTHGSGDAVEVHLVGGAAGPLGGDEFELRIEVGPGASLVVRTVAAMLALPGPAGASSRLSVRASVGTGATLRWLPEPTIAAARCHHVSHSTVDVDAGATVVWREELIAGRHGESPGRLRQQTIVRRAGAVLLHQELAIGPDADGWAGAAVLGGHRSAGSLVIVDPAWVDAGPPAAVVANESAARMSLAGPAVLCSAVAVDAPALRHALDALAAPIIGG
jgi:urease accessory protein